MRRGRSVGRLTRGHDRSRSSPDAAWSGAKRAWPGRRCAFRAVELWRHAPRSAEIRHLAWSVVEHRVLQIRGLRIDSRPLEQTAKIPSTALRSTRALRTSARTRPVYVSRRTAPTRVDDVRTDACRRSIVHPRSTAARCRARCHRTKVSCNAAWALPRDAAACDTRSRCIAHGALDSCRARRVPAGHAAIDGASSATAYRLDRQRWRRLRSTLSARPGLRRPGGGEAASCPCDRRPATRPVPRAGRVRLRTGQLELGVVCRFEAQLDRSVGLARSRAAIAPPRPPRRRARQDPNRRARCARDPERRAASADPSRGSERTRIARY